MTPSAVTAMGIRDGDHAVLEALVERRGHAVLAFCERACAPGMAIEAAGEAFARFRATVMTVEEPAGLDPESTLLSATRHAAAERVPRAVPPPTSPLGRLLGANAAPQLLAVVPSLLVARADGTLDAAGEAELTGILASSPAARGIEERLGAAEQAYKTAPLRPLDPELLDELVTAMVSEPVEEPESAEDVVVSANGGPALFASTDEAEAEAAAVVEAEPDAVPEAEATVIEAPADPEPEAVLTEAEPEPEPDAPEVGAEDEPEEPDDRTPEVEPDHTPEDEPQAEALPAEEPLEDDVDDVEHVQTASGAVEEVADPAPATPAPPPAATPLTTAETTRGLPRLPAERPAVPGRAALAPAGAVVTVAAIGAMVAAGVFGGSDPQPAVDTGLVPRSAAIEVPDGQAGAVIDDLRDAAAESRRNRIADERQRAAAAARARREARERDEAEAAAPRAAQPEARQQGSDARGNGAAARPDRDEDPPAREREREPAEDEPAAEPQADAVGDASDVPAP